MQRNKAAGTHSFAVPSYLLWLRIIAHNLHAARNLDFFLFSMEFLNRFPWVKFCLRNE